MNQITFQKNKHGKYDISANDINKFNALVMHNQKPSGQNFIPVSGSNIVEINPHNFGTCQHRSEHRERRLVVCCGGQDKKYIDGYNCVALGLFDVSMIDCMDCKKYLSKEC